MVGEISHAGLEFKNHVKGEARVHEAIFLVGEGEFIGETGGDVVGKA